MPCVDASRFAVVSQLAQQHPALYSALGLHPINIAQHQDDDLDRLEQYLQTPDVKRVAIGEIGLDLYMDAPDFARQTRLLDAQLKLAKRYDLPVILHSTYARSAGAASAPSRRAATRRGARFAGSQQQAERFIALGYAIGVGGTITYARASKTRPPSPACPCRLLLKPMRRICRCTVFRASQSPGARA